MSRISLQKTAGGFMVLIKSQVGDIDVEHGMEFTQDELLDLFNLLKDISKQRRKPIPSEHATWT